MPVFDVKRNLDHTQSTKTTEREHSAKRRVAIHSLVFACVNIALAAINLRRAPGCLWIVYPLFSWGFVLVAHYIVDVRLLPRRTAREELRSFRSPGRGGE